MVESFREAREEKFPL